MSVNLALWLLIFAQGLALEAASFLSRRDGWLPLTYYVRRYVPKVIIATVLAWLAYHFGVQGG